MFEYKTEGGDPTCTLCDKPVTGRCVYWQNGWPLHEKCFEKVRHIIKLHTDYMDWLHPGTTSTTSRNAWIDRVLQEINRKLDAMGNLATYKIAELERKVELLTLGIKP